MRDYLADDCGCAFRPVTDKAVAITTDLTRNLAFDSSVHFEWAGGRNSFMSIDQTAVV